MEIRIDAATLTPLLMVVAFGLGAMGLLYWPTQVRIRRQDFIRRFRLPPPVLDALQRRHPELHPQDVPLIEAALREFFLIYVTAGYRPIAMPSRIVDQLWYVFTLDTRVYADFCGRAFGRFLHHTPSVAISDRYGDNVRLRRTWANACFLYDLDPREALRLPLLFAIDAQLNIVDGYRYRIEDLTLDDTDATDTRGAISIAIMIDASFDGTTDGLSDGGSDDGSGDGGGGCGGD